MKYMIDKLARKRFFYYYIKCIKKTRHDPCLEDTELRALYLAFNFTSDFKISFHFSSMSSLSSTNVEQLKRICFLHWLTDL